MSFYQSLLNETTVNADIIQYQPGAITGYFLYCADNQGSFKWVPLGTFAVIDILPKSNQTTVTDDGKGGYTIGTVQDIGTSSSPTFNNITANQINGAIMTASQYYIQYIPNIVTCGPFVNMNTSNINCLQNLGPMYDNTTLLGYSNKRWSVGYIYDVNASLLRGQLQDNQTTVSTIGKLSNLQNSVIISSDLTPPIDGTYNLGSIQNHFFNIYGINLYGICQSPVQNYITTMQNLTSIGTLTGLTLGGNTLPSSNNTYNIGSNAAKFSNIYATTFNGDLNGNASSATYTSTATTANTVINATQSAITTLPNLTSINGTTITGSDLLKITSITNGYASPNKALILDGSSNIRDINNLTVNGITTLGASVTQLPWSPSIGTNLCNIALLDTGSINPVIYFNGYYSSGDKFGSTGKYTSVIWQSADKLNFKASSTTGTQGNGISVWNDFMTFDLTNARIGIKNSSPSYSFDVGGSSSRINTSLIVGGTLTLGGSADFQSTYNINNCATGNFTRVQTGDIIPAASTTPTVNFNKNTPYGLWGSGGSTGLYANSTNCFYTDGNYLYQNVPFILLNPLKTSINLPVTLSATATHRYNQACSASGVGYQPYYEISPTITTTGSLDQAIANYSQPTFQPSGGTINNAYGSYIGNIQSAGGTTTNMYGSFIDNNYKFSGTITNSYGLYLANQTYGTNNWSLWSNGKSYINSLYLPNSGGNLTAFDYYETGSYTGSVSGAWSGSITVWFTRTGRTVTLTLDISSNNTVTSTTNIEIAGMPSRLKPNGNWPSFVIVGVVNAVSVSSLAQVRADTGAIRVFASVTGSNFTSGNTNCGWGLVNITYQIL